MKDLRCTIWHVRGYIWLRWGSSESRVDLFDQIRLFVKIRLTKRLYRITFRYSKWEAGIVLNPFESVVILHAGKRFPPLMKFYKEIKFEKSKKRIEYI